MAVVATTESDEGEAHGLELLEPERLADERGQVGVEVGVGVRRREEAGDERAQRAADAVDAEGVERVVVLKSAFSLVQARYGTTPASTPISDRRRSG